MSRNANALRKSKKARGEVTVTADLWDVYWDGDGFGKHGNGPFATERQATACLRAVGWPGRVKQGRWTLQQSSLDRILKKVWVEAEHG